MKKPSFAFIYHLNLGHSELSGQHRQRMLQQDLEQLMHWRGRIPVNISSMGMDWEVINQTNQQAIQAVRDNPNVTILDGLYSHLLPSIYPQLTELAQQHSTQTTDNIFGGTSPTGFVPEHDISSLNAHHFNWAAGVINKELHSYYPWDAHHQRIVPLTNPQDIPLSTVRVKHQQGSLPCLVAEGGTLRTTYLKLMREHAEPQEFINAIKESLLAAERDGSPIVSFVMDWETPYINAVHGQPRLDLADQLSQALAEADIPFTTLDHKATETIIAYAQAQPAITHRKHYSKWQPNPFRETVRNLTKQFINGTPYEQRALLAIAESDHDSAQHGLALGATKEHGAIVQLPSFVQGRKETITIASDKHRPQEYEHMAANLAEGQPINARTDELPPTSKWYLDQLHNAFQ